MWKTKTADVFKELETLKIYPVEIIEGLLFMGDQKQAMDSGILKDMKISTIVSVSQRDTLEWDRTRHFLMPWCHCC